MFFVSSTLLDYSAVKLVTLILTVNFAITAGDEIDTKCIVAGVLVQGTGAEAQLFHLCPARVAAEVVGDLPVVVANIAVTTANKGGKEGQGGAKLVFSCGENGLCPPCRGAHPL